MFRRLFASLIVSSVLFVVVNVYSHSCWACQQLEPTFDRAQRVELARQILKPTHAKAIADPHSDARKIAFTQHWAAIDPNWTAKFLLENPHKDTGVLWDNKAMLALMERADEIDEDIVLKLLDHNSQYFVVYNYVERALKALPPEKKELRKKISDLALKAKSKGPVSLQFLNGRLDIARSTGDTKAIQLAEKEVFNFFQSGAAQKNWKAMVKHFNNAPRHQKGSMDFSFANILRHAPKEFLNDFKVPQASANKVKLKTIVYGPNMTVDALDSAEFKAIMAHKRKQLAQIDRYPFDRLPHEYMQQAADLGLVAYIDPQVALKFAKGAPNGHAKCYAWLSIAPALSIEDPDAARKLIVDCYDQVANLPQGDQVNQNYNHPPAIVAASGLPIVEFVAPDLLPDCIKATVAAAGPMKDGNLADAEANLFETIAAIARYDREAAEKLYDENKDELILHSAPGFFRAMVALHPDEVLDEFKLIPETDERKINHQIQVRNAILPALLAENDDEYWTSLFGSFYIKLEPRVVALKARQNK